jgi:hypothetical protein
MEYAVMQAVGSFCYIVAVLYERARQSHKRIVLAIEVVHFLFRTPVAPVVSYIEPLRGSERSAGWRSRM